MQTKALEYAMIKVSVTTAGGIIPIENAKVRLSYNTIPGVNDSGEQLKLTDHGGNTEIFKIPIKRAVIGGRRVDFPRRAECNVEIVANGFVTLRTRAIHLFPDVTVMSSFDLMPMSKKLDA